MASPDPPTSDANSPTPRLQQLGETGQRVFQCLSLGLVVFDHQLKIIHHNPASEFLVREHTSIAEALTTVTVDARYQDWPKAIRQVLESGRQQRFDLVLYRDSEYGELLLNLLFIAITDQTGNQITGGTLVIEDVTAAVSMENRLAVSERMAAVGKLAARVAHELNNPLDGILRYINLALRALETNTTEKIDKYLREAHGGILRITEIVRELVEFSRSAYTAFDDAGINNIVEEAVKVMSEKAVTNGVSIACKFNEGMPAIRGTNLFQVFCNLIKNAVDAMPNGGTLTVTTGIEEHQVVVRFEDTGIGLPEEIDQIFEPFFTTKEPGKGTGLGLAISKDIVEKYNGKIIPQRRSDKGTVFTICIPLESCATIRSSRTSPGSSAPGPDRPLTEKPK